MTQLVVPLRDLGPRDLAIAGGKGANLGALLRAGFAVPDGFVVTTSAYVTVVARAGLDTTIEQALASGNDGAGIRGAFDGVTMPEDIGTAITDAYGGLGNTPVAVRSSATAEDLPGATFAGQQDTYLNVVGAPALLDAVRRCWGSLWTDRAIAYRRRRGIDPRDVRIAVVVQRMVPAESAGVLFTANPVSGARDELVIDASSGLGEAVVSGLVTPDHYVVDRGGQVRHRTPGRHEVVIRGAEGGGVTRTAGDATAAKPLPATVLAELARLGTAVAALFGRPQDIEWAYAGGTVWLVQARPMTALPPPPLRLNRLQRITGPMLVELLPIRPYPLDMSAWTAPGHGHILTRMLDDLVGLHVDMARVLPEVDGVVERFVPPVPRPTLRTLTAPARVLPRLLRHDPATWTEDPRFAAFERRVEHLRTRAPASLDWAELCRVPREAHAALDALIEVRLAYLPRVGASLALLRLVVMALRRTVLFPALLVGAPTRTRDANRALAGVAERVRADAAARAAFADLDPQVLAERVHDDPDLRDVRVALDDVLAEYGHRETTSPLLMSSPTWCDVPATVLGIVKVLVTDPPAVTATDRAAQAMADLLRHPLVRLTRSGPAVRRLVDAARTGIAFREDTHFHGTRVLPVLRHALLEMGRRLAAAGVLADRSDILHLRLEEVEALPDPVDIAAPAAERLRAAVRRRAARREELAGVPLITAASLFPAAADGDAGMLVSGVAAGGGRVTGPVRVIREPAEFGLLRGGDILVCPYTNPAWTPLFARAAAVVVDGGGLGSHAAIVAREYGIPAVMGTGGATTTLTDGQVVTVDGDTGRVTGHDARDAIDGARPAAGPEVVRGAG